MLNWGCNRDVGRDAIGNLKIVKSTTYTKNYKIRKRQILDILLKPIKNRFTLILQPHMFLFYEQNETRRWAKTIRKARATWAFQISTRTALGQATTTYKY